MSNPVLTAMSAIVAPIGAQTTPFINTKSLDLGATNSNKYVDFGNNYDLATGAAVFSFAGWVYLVDTTPTFEGILDKQNPASPFQGWTLLWNSSGGNTQKFRFQLGSTTPKLLDVTTNNTFTLNAWHFIALTYDGSKTTAGVKIYVDSNTAEAITGSSNLDAASTSTTQPLRLGYSESNASFLRGKVNQFSFFNNYVLTTVNVLSLLNSGHPGDLTGLANLSSWWKLNQSDSATTITDHKGAITGTGANLVSGDFVASVP